MGSPTETPDTSQTKTLSTKQRLQSLPGKPPLSPSSRSSMRSVRESGKKPDDMVKTPYPDTTFHKADIKAHPPNKES